MRDDVWVSLMIGNSRLHWALLEADSVIEMWDSDHLGKAELRGTIDVASHREVERGIPLSLLPDRARDILLGDDASVCATVEKPPTDDGGSEATHLAVDPKRFKVASVVPKELDLWLRRCPGLSPLSSSDALSGVAGYPTLGVDRALAVRGAARLRGWPVMVVDCGSALTFTASDEQGCLAGGAILPGVRLQLSALGTRTAQLPSDVLLPEKLPPRWAMGTSGGIQSGVMWTIVAGIHSFIKDRWKLEPNASVVFTGGDGQVLHRAVLDSWEGEETGNTDVRDRIKYVREVIHWGIASVALATVP